MQTEKLYNQNAHMRSFTARVLSCESAKGGYEVLLNRSAFYPEGGGQPGDHGTINGVAVLDTQERSGEIVHLCEAPLKVGEEAVCELDWKRRFDFMQLHSGEHIVSGIVHHRFGYNNVGFHMGADMVTIDFSGMLSEEELKSIEAEANEAVWANLPVVTTCPGPAELAEIPYRSKKELTGTVRIVTIPDVDICACCGTHVSCTGEIGLIKIFSCQKFHEGVRLEILCGRRAVEYVNALVEQNRRNSALLSEKPKETSQGVQRILDELSRTKYRCASLERRIVAAKAAELTGAGNVLLFENELSMEAVRLLAASGMECCGGICAVFCGDDANGYKYIIGLQNGSLQEFVKRLNAALRGRGGGKPGFVQGSAAAKRSEIEAFWEEQLK